MCSDTKMDVLLPYCSNWLMRSGMYTTYTIYWCYKHNLQGKKEVYYFGWWLGWLSELAVRLRRFFLYLHATWMRVAAIALQYGDSYLFYQDHVRSTPGKRREWIKKQKNKTGIMSANFVKKYISVPCLYFHFRFWARMHRLALFSSKELTNLEKNNASCLLSHYQCQIHWYERVWVFFFFGGWGGGGGSRCKLSQASSHQFTQDIFYAPEACIR